MHSTGDFDEHEIEESISTIRKLTNENLRRHSNTIPEIRMRLQHLKDFLTQVDDSRDLWSVINDYIENISCIPICADMNNRLVLKVNTNKLEKEFEHFKNKKNLYS